MPDPPDGYPPASSDQPPILNRVDGGARSMAWHAGTSPSAFDAVSRDFWRFDRSTGTLQIPNGDVCQYGGSSGSQNDTRHVQSCVDPFGNLLEFNWDLVSSPPTLIITQHLSDSTGRQITITFSDESGNDLESIEYAGRTWTYSQTTVTPPAPAPGWTFGYDVHDIVSVITPNGGKIEYLYENIPYVGPTGPPDQYWTRAVVTRTLRDRDDTPLGQWEYQYAFDPNAASGVTTVKTPTGRVVYTHGAGTATSPASLFDGNANLSVLSRNVQRLNEQSEWVTAELELRTYEYVPVIPIMGTEELKSVTITREGTTPYVTTYTYSPSNNGDYHRPNSITETGPAGTAATRTTGFTYRHCPSPECPGVYVTGLPLSEALTVNNQPFSKSWTYDLQGFQTSETTYGIKTDFGKDARGNIANSRTAMNKVTEFTYDFGQASSIETPHYTITREINPDGSIHSETRAGRITVFDYDDAGRLKSVQPPGANATVITYDSGGEWVRTERVASPNTPSPKTTETLDAFGRTIQVAKRVTKVGGPETEVLTETHYDVEGRVVEQTHPFTPGAPSGGTPKWTEFKYDVLGRLTEVKHPDLEVSTRSYGVDGDVTIVNERNQPTTEVWRGVGSPDQARLVGLLDAHGKYWGYTYNALGKLTGLTSQAEAGGPGSLTRTWIYDSHNLLESESHPELGSLSQSGSIGYLYDLAGVLIQKTDANGKRTTFEYDGNDRVKKITADGHITLITYEPGSDNRASALKVGAGTYWFYDPAGRLQSRHDNISGKSFTTTFEYDEFDNLRGIQHPTGRHIRYDVDAAGRPTRIFETAAPRDYAANITYHPSGGVASYLSNGLTTTIAYDADRYRVSSINAGDLQLTYSQYDEVGNPTAIGDSRANHSQTFAYDGLDRLIAAAGVYGTTQYTYNLHGNRTGDYQYESNKLRLASQTSGGVTTTFTYDNNGNTLTAGSSTFTYTPQDQVEKATVPGSVFTYAYDADDQRVKKTDGTTTSYFIRGIGGELLTEWTNPGTATGRARDYIYLGTRLLSAVARNRTDDPVSGLTAPPTQSHRFATSWQVPSGAGNGNVTINNGASAAARKSNHPDMPRTGLRLGPQNAGAVDYITNGPYFNGNNADHPKQSGLFLEFAVERYPFSADAEILGTDGAGSLSSSTDDLRLYVTPGGQLVLKHDGARPTPQTLWTSAPVGLNTSHTLELRFEYNSNDGPYPSPNPAWEDLTSRVQLYFDGSLVTTYGASGATWTSSENYPYGLDLPNGMNFLGNTKLKSPGPANGLLMNVWRAGLISATNHGETLDYYGSTWRTTLVEAAGPGTHSQWTGGQPDWRARTAIAGGGGGFINPVTSNVVGQKISYLMESMLARGISGNIATVSVGVRMQAVTPNTKAFIRRNGVETVLSNLTLGPNDFRWYRVATAGWSPADVVEVGVTVGDVGNNWLQSVALLVEHNTPEPAPLTDTTASVKTVNYIGNGTAQTIDFGVDALPTALFVVPVNTAARLIWWWDSRQGAATMGDSITNFGRIWPQKGKFHVVHTTPYSYNASGVSYKVIALFDSSGRYVIPFAVSKAADDDDYTHYLRHPQSGELASTFTPDFVFGGAAFGGLQDPTRASLYKGPGHAGDLTGKLGVTLAADADRIQAMGAGTVQFGTTVAAPSSGDHAFWAGRVSDGVSSTRLTAVTSYVGDGTASRNIPLILTGSTPVFALVVPTTAVGKVYRVTGDTTGRRTDSGNAVANSITALGANQITVGIGLNAVGVTYDVWTITTGTAQ